MARKARIATWTVAVAAVGLVLAVTVGGVVGTDRVYGVLVWKTWELRGRDQEYLDRAKEAALRLYAREHVAFSSEFETAGITDGEWEVRSPFFIVVDPGVERRQKRTIEGKQAVLLPEWNERTSSLFGEAFVHSISATGWGANTARVVILTRGYGPDGVLFNKMGGRLVLRCGIDPDAECEETEHLQY